MNRASQVRRLMKRFGELPESWDFVPLRDLLEERQETSSDIAQYPLNSLIIGEGIVPKDERYNRKFLLRDEEKNRYNLVYPGDFVFNPMNLRFGAIAYSRHKVPITVSAYYTVLAPSKREFDPRYLYKLLTSYQIMDLYDVIAIGSLIEKRRVYWSDLKELVIPFPPLEVQRTIGTIIDAWDKAITLTEQRIDAAQRLKKGLMQRLLTGRVRFPGFEEEWRRASLGSIATVNPPKPKNLPDDTLVSFIAMADVSEDAQVINISERPYAEVSIGYTPFQDNDVIVAKITPCFENGKGALVKGLKNGIGFGSTEFHVLRANDTEILPEFLYYHMIAHDFRGRGESNMAGSAGQKRIRTDFVRTYKITLPPIEEQRRIVAVLQTCDQEIELLQQKRDALQRQKKGLMQRLLTGRVRVSLPPL